MKKNILIIFGTRPEAIKMAPVVKALEEAKKQFNVVICVTGQHREILDQMLSIFNLRPDIDLDLMAPNQTLPSLTAKAIIAVSETIDKVKPDITLVQGDTTTAMVAGLASFYSKVAVGHVEAGLRTGNKYDPFPEEINRRLLSSLASFHFAPTQSSADSLIKEGHDISNVFVTGNTVIDALLWTTTHLENPKSLAVKLESSKYILVTAHRRENFGKPIRDICMALEQIVKNNEIDIIYPVHPNPNIKEPVHAQLGNIKKIHLIEPLEYVNFVKYMSNAHLLLTDSGGVQEEAPSLGKPVLVMRETTERPEAVDAGVAKLVGTRPSSIVTEVEKLLKDPVEYGKMANASNPFGDGTASKQIVEILSNRL